MIHELAVIIVGQHARVINVQRDNGLTAPKRLPRKESSATNARPGNAYIRRLIALLNTFKKKLDESVYKCLTLWTRHV